MKVILWSGRIVGFITLLLIISLIVSNFIPVDLQYRMAAIFGIAGAEEVGDMLVNITFIISLVISVFLTGLFVIIKRGKKR